MCKRERSRGRETETERQRVRGRSRETERGHTHTHNFTVAGLQDTAFWQSSLASIIHLCASRNGAKLCLKLARSCTFPYTNGVGGTLQKLTVCLASLHCACCACCACYVHVCACVCACWIGSSVCLAGLGTSTFV